MTTIHLEPSQVPAVMRGSYTGKYFKAVVCETVSIPFDAGLWEGGSRNSYHMINLETGEQSPVPGQEFAPWDKDRSSREIPLRPGMGIVRHSIFCGKDMGLTFYILEQNATKLLPAPSESLSETDQKVLEIIGSTKSSYRKDEARRMNINDATYATSVASLKALGMLDTRGAITVKGKNARIKR